MERGSFSNITEDSLKNEIEKNNEEANADGFNMSPKEESLQLDDLADFQMSKDYEDGKETWQEKKYELSSAISAALNETSLSLDFVSLLVTAVKPNVGKSTMSPHLSKTVSLGSLGSDRLFDNDSTSNNVNQSKIGHGWKVESLRTVTDLFRNASLEMSEQIIKEKSYWDMISVILANDEFLRRTRDPVLGSKEIAINYGFGDSGSTFHDKGLATLKKDNSTGEIIFQPVSSSNRIANKVYRYVRVKILSKIDDDYMLTGQSIFDKNVLNKSKFKIINDIELARFFLFEEDLFYFLTREGKFLVNYNVLIIGNQIMIEMNGEIIQIESVIYDDSNEDELSNYYQNINEQSSINNSKAQAILVFLKLMLCCFYKYNLSLKQKMPTTLTKWKQSNSHPLILRLLLGHIRHEANIKSMLSTLNSVMETYKDQLKFNLKYERYHNLKVHENDISNPFIKSVERPVTTFEFVASKGNNQQHMKIAIELTTTETFCNLVLNLDAVRFELLDGLEKNTDGANILHISFYHFVDIKESLDWTILNFIQK